MDSGLSVTTEFMESQIDLFGRAGWYQFVWRTGPITPADRRLVHRHKSQKGHMPSIALSRQGYSRRICKRLHRRIQLVIPSLQGESRSVLEKGRYGRCALNFG